MAEPLAAADEPVAPSRAASGSGSVEIVSVNGRSVIARATATSPLKLLTPQTRSTTARIFTSTYGGGLVGGDSISLHVAAGESTRCILGTQASTKVYRSIGKTCAQHLTVSAAEDAIIVIAPDPLVCFAGARYEQRQDFDLASSASLVMIDWFTSGRHARGERWAFDSYRSRTEVRVDGRAVFRDALSLDPRDGALADPMRMGAIDCYATVVILGDFVGSHVQQILRDISTLPAHNNDGGPLVAASPIGKTGVVIRVAATQTESVGHWLRRQLSFVPQLLGVDPWDRKW